MPASRLPLPPWLQHTAVRVSLAAGVGLGVGFALIPSLPTPDHPDTAPPQLQLLGHILPNDDSAGELALDRVRQHVAGQLLLDLGEEQRAIPYARLGVAIDTVRLTQLVRDGQDATSPLRRQRGLARGPIELPVPLVVDEQRAFELLRALKDELDRTPRDARIDVAARQVLPEQKGRALDIDRTLGALQTALSSGQTRLAVVFHERAPRRTSVELSSVRYEQTLAFFETPYDRSDKAKARTFNLQHAAKQLDGMVLMPGEQFDFNAVVGPRDEAHGYQVAPVIAEGELVDGIGGGTCQISGTLHGAVFFAGLPIVERHPHTRPSSYMKLGLDAAVAYPTMNLRFQNGFAFPIVVHQTVEGGTVRAEIRGAEVGPAVTLIRRIESTTAYDQLDRPDDRIAFGKRVLFQRGVPGFQVKRYRIVRNDEHAVRDVWHDTYPPTTQIVLLGAKNEKSAADAPRGDPHPEYLADELLVLTKQRATPEEPTRYSERREPGRFGERGWTEAAGMPYFDTD